MNNVTAYKVERLQSWDEFTDKIAEPRYEDWAYRGQADGAWPLMSSLGRYLTTYVEEEYWEDQEMRIHRIFQRRSHRFLTHVPDRSDTFQSLALMQHYGAPTRLLDFTWSPYVAAFFALERTTTEAAVWAINPERLVNITERLDEFLKGSLTGAIGIGDPFIMNDRIVAQTGTFLVTRQVGVPIEDIVREYKHPEDTLVKFLLPAHLVRSAGMRSLLMMNVTNATLFPGLDGLARSLAYELEFSWIYNRRKVLKSTADDNQ